MKFALRNQQYLNFFVVIFETIHQNVHFFMKKSNYQYACWNLCDSIAFSWGLICALVRNFNMIFIVKTRFGAPFFRGCWCDSKICKSLQTWIRCLLSEGRFFTKKTVLKALSRKKMSQNARGVGGVLILLLPGSKLTYCKYGPPDQDTQPVRFAHQPVLSVQTLSELILSKSTGRLSIVLPSNFIRSHFLTFRIRIFIDRRLYCVMSLKISCSSICPVRSDS